MKNKHHSDNYFMQKALNEAKVALDKNEVPVGAVVVHQNQVIGRGHNQIESLKDSTAHAEMIAITSALNYMHSKYLTNCSIYITLEPCIMCAGAIFLSRIKNIFFAAEDTKFGFYSSQKLSFNHNVNIVKGSMSESSKYILNQFFNNKR